MKISTIFILLIVLALIPVVNAETCKISTGHGLLLDTDCDRVPDTTDNCPIIFNPSQEDMNRNGLGDMCDVIISDVELSTDTSRPGQALDVFVQMRNNLPLQVTDIKLTADIPRLEAQAETLVAPIPPGAIQETDERAHVKIRIPSDAKEGTYDMVLTTTFNVNSMKASNTVRVPVQVEGDSINENEGTNIDAYEIQDITRGRGAIYPISITNEESNAKSYVLRVEGVDFGTWRIDPNTVLVIEPGMTKQAFLYVSADDKAQDGQYGFTLTITSDGEMQKIQLRANVVKEPTKNGNPLTVLLVIIALLAIAGIILAVSKSMQRRPRF
ncbi:MAG: hypothetical protein ABIA93_01405 [Candidatus Woesearchaeota archaeon]